MARLLAAAAALALFHVLLVVAARPPRDAGELSRATTGLVAAGRWQDALAPALALTRAHPDDHIYLQHLATIYGRLERPADEATTWEAFMKVSPTPVDACPAVGQAHERAGNAAAALDAFARCLALDPDDTDAMVFAGLAAHRANRDDEAVRYFTQGLALTGDDPDLHFGMGLVDERAGRLDAARARFERALAIDAARDDVRQRLARLGAPAP